MSAPLTVQAFAYAALKAAGDDKAAAIVSLTTILSGQYTTASSGNGRVMTSVNAGNKSFSYTLPDSFGPKEITEITFQAIQLLSQHTTTELTSMMFQRRRSTARAGFY